MTRLGSKSWLCDLTKTAYATAAGLFDWRWCNNKFNFIKTKLVYQSLFKLKKCCWCCWLCSWWWDDVDYALALAFSPKKLYVWSDDVLCFMFVVTFVTSLLIYLCINELLQKTRLITRIGQSEMSHRTFFPTVYMLLFPYRLGLNLTLKCIGKLEITEFWAFLIGQREQCGWFGLVKAEVNKSESE